MSLVTVIAAVSDFVASAWLVAVIWTVAGEGKSGGAVYMPSAVMVPSAALPPAVPFTLQTTTVSVVFVTLAENAAAFPSNTDPLFGVSVTTMEGGGGGGGCTRLAPPPPQPCIHTPAVRSATTICVLPILFPSLRVRGRIPVAKQEKGQRKKRRNLTQNGAETLPKNSAICWESEGYAIRLRFLTRVANCRSFHPCHSSVPNRNANPRTQCRFGIASRHDSFVDIRIPSTNNPSCLAPMPSAA